MNFFYIKKNYTGTEEWGNIKISKRKLYNPLITIQCHIHLTKYISHGWILIRW